MKEKRPPANAAGGMNVVPKDSRAFVGDWHVAPEAKPCLAVVRGEGKPQASSPFVRGKREEPPAQLPSDNYFG